MPALGYGCSEGSNSNVTFNDGVVQNESSDMRHARETDNSQPGGGGIMYVVYVT